MLSALPFFAAECVIRLHLRIAPRSSRNERGASAIEYGLLLAGIAAALLFVSLAFGAALEVVFESTCANVSDGVTGGTC